MIHNMDENRIKQDFIEMMKKESEPEITTISYYGTAIDMPKKSGFWHGSSFLMKLYHGTSRENAKRILMRGFKLSKTSNDFFYGRGLYFKPTVEGAKMYGDVVLEVEIKVQPCEVDKWEGIGIFEQWAGVECKELRDEHCCDFDDECFRRYNEFAEDERKNRLDDGCPVISNGTQTVIFDEKIIRSLKPVRWKEIGI